MGRFRRKNADIGIECIDSFLEENGLDIHFVIDFFNYYGIGREFRITESHKKKGKIDHGFVDRLTSVVRDLGIPEEVLFNELAQYDPMYKAIVDNPLPEIENVDDLAMKALCLFLVNDKTYNKYATGTKLYKHHKKYKRDEDICLVKDKESGIGYFLCGNNNTRFEYKLKDFKDYRRAWQQARYYKGE